jgi:dolichyl-phosphate beta-glucosyltransferase
MASPLFPKLSLVIPAYNEAHRLPDSLEKIIDYGRGFTFEWEVLAVIERSSDGTLELARAATAKQANFRIIDNKVHRGKGYAIRTGMLQARGEYIFYMDADLSVPLETVGTFLAYFEGHPEVDVLAGNRQHSHSRITRKQALLRRSMGQTFNRILRIFAGVALRDTQCGFKAFRRKAALAVFRHQKIDGFAFDVEVLMLAERLGYKIVDLPVEWINSPESRVHLLRDSLSMLRDAIQVRQLVDEELGKKRRAT